MLLYRSIGQTELKKIINEIPVRGIYDCELEPQTTCDKNNVICLFTQPFKWTDKAHTFHLTLDIPDSEITFGKAYYYMSKNAVKTKQWSGRYGEECVTFDEAYIDQYTIDNVLQIEGICAAYAKWYIDTFRHTLEKHNIRYL